MSKAIKSVGRAVSRIVKGVAKGIRKFAKSTLGKVVLTVVAGMILGPAVGSLMQSAGGALAAGAAQGSLASIVGSGLSSVGSFIGGTGAAAGSGLSGALEAAATSVTTSVGNAFSGVKSFFGGGSPAPTAGADPGGWVSAEGGAGYSGGMAADASQLAAPVSFDSGANVEQMTSAANPLEVPQSNVPPSLAEKPVTVNSMAQPPQMAEPGGLRVPQAEAGGLRAPQMQPAMQAPAGSSKGWLSQIMNDSRAKSALITGGMQLGGGLISGYGQARAAQAAYDRERERVRRNQDVSGLRV